MKPLPRLRTLFKQLEQLELVTSPETNEYILADTVTLVRIICKPAPV